MHTTVPFRRQHMILAIFRECTIFNATGKKRVSQIVHFRALTKIRLVAVLEFFTVC